MKRFAVILFFGVLFLNQIACSTNPGVRTSDWQPVDKNDWSNLFTVGPAKRVQVILKDGSEIKGELKTVTKEFIFLSVLSVTKSLSQIFPKIFWVPKKKKEEKRFQRHNVFSVERLIEPTLVRRTLGSAGMIIGFIKGYNFGKETKYGPPRREKKVSHPTWLAIAWGTLTAGLGAAAGGSVGWLIDTAAKRRVLIYEADQVSVKK